MCGYNTKPGVLVLHFVQCRNFEPWDEDHHVKFSLVIVEQTAKVTMPPKQMHAAANNEACQLGQQAAHQRYQLCCNKYDISMLHFADTPAGL